VAGAAMMRQEGVLEVRSYRRAGRLTPLGATGLRAGAVTLRPGGVVGWHSTRQREELLIALSGRIQVEIRERRRKPLRLVLNAGSCAVLPRATPHRVVNRSTRNAHYLYVTAPASGDVHC
jgi:mannose-6-phosphate isomerase-like protein (cupin superfamily)